MFREVAEHSLVSVQPTIVSLFEKQASEHPDSIALKFGDTTMRYDELNRRANMLAHLLRNMGVGTDVLVGLCVERSFEMVIGILGILKAGAAYMPLDPDYPTDRLSFMICDSNAPVLLTQQHLITRLPETDACTLCLDADWERIASQPDVNMEYSIAPNDLIYVIYTSGSTGNPKGVMNTHAGVVNRIVWMCDTFEFDRHDVVLQKTPFSFDVSGWEFFVPLICGACLVIAAPGGHLDPDYLVDIIRLNKITGVHFVPSMLNLFLEADGVEHCSSLRWVFCSGEALSAHSRDRFFGRLSCELHNLYGPTEAAIEVTHWQCNRSDTDTVIPIGWPIRNTTAYILDENGKRLSGDLPGELCLGGIAVARGYLNRPDLTAEKFVPDPFSTSPGAQLYRTGDRARWRPDGSIEYLGRLDFQVKIRGQRIELGEIENILATHRDVLEVVVLAREDSPGDQRLVGYVVASLTGQKEADMEAELKSQVRLKLPEYMVPAHIVFLVSLPLSPSGKVDRKSLPIPDVTHTDLCVKEAPRTSLEKLVAEIWCEVLNLPSVGVDQDFFSLGGHSLLAVQIVTRLRRTLGRAISVRALFTDPTVEQLARMLERSSGDADAHEAIPTFSDIEKAERPSISPMQRWLYYACAQYTNSPRYNIPIQLSLHCHIDIAILHAALQTIVERHEPLRSNFSFVQGELQAVVQESAILEMQVLDLRSDLADAEARAATAILEEASRPFDLEHDLLVRALLVQVGTHDHKLLINVHHLVCDGWSVTLFLRELTSLYEAMVTHRVPELTDLYVCYSDYAEWLRQFEATGAYASRLEYWNNQLAGVPASIDLPTDYPRSGNISDAGGQVSLMLTQELSASLQSLSSRHGTTLYMTVMAAWQALLYRYTMQQEFVVYAPFGGRTHYQIEPLIGYFVNVLPVRATVTQELSATELLRQVRDRTLDAYAHQEVTVEQISGAPHPQTLVTVFSDSGEPWALHDVPFEKRIVGTGTSKLELSLLLDVDATGIHGVIEYSSQLFREETIQALAGHFETLLAGMASSPESLVIDLPLLTGDEQRQIESWNGQMLVLPSGSNVHSLFEVQAEQTPSSVAVIFGKETLSYGELNHRANCVAHRLLALGVIPGSTVGICLERSFEMVIGVLGILKAGCSYIPLDPAYPSERLGFIVSSSGMSAILLQEMFASYLPDNELPRVFLDSDWPTIASESSGNLLLDINPQTPVYVMYTSGSTGQPKGVAYPHVGLLNTLVWMQETLGLTSSDRILLKTPFGFDVSSWELFWPLMFGAGIVIARPGGHLDVDYIIDVIEEHAVTTINFVPSMLNLFLESDSLKRCGTLSRVISAGEALTAATRDRFFGRLNDTELHNIYGPTETNGITWWQCLREDTDSVIPIGRPIANSQVWILDGNGKPVGLGMVGEIYLGGVNVACGYHNRLDLTAEKFTPNPFCNEPGSRLYRTGDLGRWRADGSVEYMGRTDFQVKIRGHRIELGEIEAVLCSDPVVTEAVVVAREDTPGDQRLVAYVVLSDPLASESETESVLKSVLRSRLPEYMVPSHILFLADIPLSPNGKADRKSLSAPDLSVNGHVSCTAPRTPTEEILSQIWCEVLNIPTVAVDLDFFALGGHSLQALRCLRLIRQRLDVELSIRDFFKMPTIALLARQIEAQRGIDVEPFVELMRVSGDVAPVLSPTQRWLGYACVRDFDSSRYNIPILLQFQGDLDIEALRSALQSVVERHEVLRSQFFLTHGDLGVRYREAVDFILSVQDLTGPDLSSAMQLAGREAEVEANRPFDIGNDVLLRANLWKLAANAHMLLITVHHLVFDGWSESMLLRELAEIYNGFRSGRTMPVGEPAIRYRDFAAWRCQLEGEPYHMRRVAYWNHQLAEIPSRLDLPYDRPPDTGSTSRGGKVSMVFTTELISALRNLARREGITLFMLFMAAWQATLARCAGQTRFVVYVPFAGRIAADTDNVIGYFVNLLPICASVDSSATVVSLLHSVRRRIVEADVYQAVSVDRLKRIPPVQTVVVFRGNQADAACFEGAIVRTDYIYPQSPKFELGLSVTEDGSSLIGQIEYNADLFEGSSVQRIATQLTMLLEAFSADARRTLGTISVVSDADVAQLAQWNTTDVDYPADRCIHTLFEEQARATPEAIALVFGTQCVSYRELDQNANLLARYLQDCGVVTSSLVGLCTVRSVEMVTAMLAILKLGAAYVPFDPEYPVDRLRYMFDDTGIRFLLTLRELVVRIPMTPSIQTICLDSVDLRSVDDAAALETAFDAVSSTDPCYVMYTSGSTGRSKGVCIPHRGVVRLVKGANYATFSPNDIYLQYASISFDASTLEIWAPLLTGGRLVIAPPGLLSLAELGSIIRDHRISVLWLTASLFQLMVAECLEDLKGVRQLLAGGDILSTAAVRRLLSEAPGTTLVNGYGPTESTTFACCHVMTNLVDAGDPVPIGRPVSNTRIYILSADGREQPIGIAGELAIGGDGLACGYLNNAELTRERFRVGLPGRPDERVYLTGDLARWRSDGVVEFIGRKDNQVKIRGYRVEPGEVEGVLGEVAGVRQCVVVAVDDGGGGKRLVAYAVVDGEVTTGHLRRKLAEKLPHYIVPSEFVLLESLPLNANGKVDRQALPRPAAIRDFVITEQEATNSTEIEASLIRIWGDVLRLPRVGIDQDFFSLGGHSLLAIQMFSRIESELGVRASVSLLYRASTIRTLAEQLKNGMGAESHRLNPIQTGGNLPPVFCMYRLDGLDMCYRELAIALGSEQPVYGFTPAALGGDADVPLSLAEIAAGCVRELRVFYPDGPYLLAGSSFGGMLAYEMAQQLRTAGAEVALLALFDTYGRASEVHRPARSRMSKLAAHLKMLSRLRGKRRLHYLAVRLKIANFIPESMRLPEDTDGLLPEDIKRIQDAHMKALWEYQPTRYGGKIVLFRAQERNLFRYDANTKLWWGDLISDDCIVDVAGSHEGMLETPHVSDLANKLRSYLNAAL